MSTLRSRSRSSANYAVGSFEWAEAILANTGRLTPEQLALVLENNPDTALTRTLRHYLVRLKRRERTSGVKPRNAAAWEFILFDAKALCETILVEVHQDAHAKMSCHSTREDPEQAAERAYRAVLEEMKICRIDWMTLKNLLSLRGREPTLFFDLDSEPCHSNDELAA